MFLQCRVQGRGKKRGHDLKYWGENPTSNQDELNKIVKELFSCLVMTLIQNYFSFSGCHIHNTQIYKCNIAQKKGVRELFSEILQKQVVEIFLKIYVKYSD